jgi:hypothetical protein
MSDFKWFLFMGEKWTAHAFLNIISDTFKWTVVQPSSVILIQVSEDNAEYFVEVLYNDEPVPIKGACLGNTTCSLIDFIESVKESGAYYTQEMKGVCVT